jgi:rubrerythrin
MLKCKVCGYEWEPKNKGMEPKQCPNCGTKLWKKGRDEHTRGRRPSK